MTAGLAEVIAANVRHLRKRHGWTLDDFSQELRGYGFDWSTGRLGDIEAGRGAARIDTLAGLAIALGSSISELLAAKEGMALNDTLTLTQKHWADLLGGKQIFVAPTAPPAGLPLADSRAIKRLGVTPEDYRKACMDLWGRLMSGEVVARSASAASPQQRGQLTRHLQRQLQDQLGLAKTGHEKAESHGVG